MFGNMIRHVYAKNKELHKGNNVKPFIFVDSTSNDHATSGSRVNGLNDYIAGVVKSS